MTSYFGLDHLGAASMSVTSGVYNWMFPPKDPKLNPFTSLLRLAAFAFYPEGSRVAIRDTAIVLQPPGWGQTYDRNHPSHRDHHTDLKHLEDPLRLICNNLDAKNDKRTRLFFRCASLGLANLQDLYRKESKPEYEPTILLLEKLRLWIQQAMEWGCFASPEDQALCTAGWTVREIKIMYDWLEDAEAEREQPETQAATLRTINSLLDGKDLGVPLDVPRHIDDSIESEVDRVERQHIYGHLDSAASPDPVRDNTKPSTVSDFTMTYYQMLGQKSLVEDPE